MAKKEFRAKNSNMRSYLESHRGDSSGPAGLRGLRKQVTEAKEGPWELWREEAEITR